MNDYVLPLWIIAISLGVRAAAVAGFLAWSAWQAMGSRWGWLRKWWSYRRTKDPGWIGNRGD